MHLTLRPITLKEACAFIKVLHRHNLPPAGHKFSIGVNTDDVLVGVAVVGRPIARMLDDGLTAEIARTCTNGYPNANSMLYGAAARACKAMGYYRVITYTQQDESGASLRAAGFTKVKDLAPRPSWVGSSVEYREIRNSVGTVGETPRVLWELRYKYPARIPLDLQFQLDNLEGEYYVTDVMDSFNHLQTLSQLQLFERRSALVGSAPNGDYRQLSDEVLQELVAIHRILRKHSGSNKPGARAVRSEIPTADQL